MVSNILRCPPGVGRSFACAVGKLCGTAVDYTVSNFAVRAPPPFASRFAQSVELCAVYGQQHSAVRAPLPLCAYWYIHTGGGEIFAGEAPGVRTRDVSRRANERKGVWVEALFFFCFTFNTWTIDVCI